MKVTALISDELIEQVRRATGGKNITDSITIALQEYLKNQKINYLIDEVEREPLLFQEEMGKYGMRDFNRTR